MQALFTLTPAESKRLIGKAMAVLPEIRQAKEKGYLLVGRGSTNAYILEEIMGKQVNKERYVAGQVVKGVLCVLGAGDRIQPISFYKGEVLAVEPGSLLDKLGPGDILLKGANAIDATGNVGIAMGGPTGGTIGQFYMAMKARGLQIIYPVGLEKLVPSVETAAAYGGILRIGKSIGTRVGMACIVGGRTFTEINAIESLFGIAAVHFASGGWGGAEGAVTLVVEGPDEQVEKCVGFIEQHVKGEPLLPAAKSPCAPCSAPCSFAGTKEENVPGYLKKA